MMMNCTVVGDEPMCKIPKIEPNLDNPTVKSEIPSDHEDTGIYISNNIPFVLLKHAEAWLFGNWITVRLSMPDEYRSAAFCVYAFTDY